MLEILELENNETGDYLELYDLSFEEVVNEYLGTEVYDDYNIINIKINIKSICDDIEYFFENIKEKYKNDKKVQLETVNNNGEVIKYIENPTEEIQLASVREYGFSIRYIEDPTEEIQLEAIKYNEYVIKDIKNPTEEVQLEAVKQSGKVIDYIDNPSEEIQLEAVKQDREAIEYIDNPSEEVKKIANNK